MRCVRNTTSELRCARGCVSVSDEKQALEVEISGPSQTYRELLIWGIVFEPKKE